MRTGEFIAKHNITYDTVRHYIDMGLLVTEKEGSNYKFGYEDSKDIKKITELKELEFSLSEIQSILSFQRLAGLKTGEYLNYYLKLLKDKKEYIIKEEQRFKNSRIKLNNLIEDTSAALKNNSNKLGIPISSIGLLKCPTCKQSLLLEEGYIEKNMILGAKIHCNCGYNANIIDGIYVDKTCIRQKLKNGKAMLTKDEYLKTCSPKYINFLCNGMSQLVNNINRYGKEPKYIMELDNCVGFFLMQYIKELPKDATYILIDYDLDRINNVKNNLENHYDHNNFIFICCDIGKLPIANSSIDIIVDNFLSTNYGVSNNSFLIDEMLSLVKEDGIITGTYRYIKSSIKNLNNLKGENNKYYNRSFMLDRLLESNISLLDVIDSGPVVENNSINKDINGKELYHASYIAKRKTNQEIEVEAINLYEDKMKIS